MPSRPARLEGINVGLVLSPSSRPGIPALLRGLVKVATLPSSHRGFWLGLALGHHPGGGRRCQFMQLALRVRVRGYPWEAVKGMSLEVAESHLWTRTWGRVSKLPS